MSVQKPVSKTHLEALRVKFPDLPAAYFVYLETVGWGEADSGRMIYSGPVAPSSIYDGRFAGSRIILLGDDMQGYCFGFDRDTKRLGEISDQSRRSPDEVWEVRSLHLGLGMPNIAIEISPITSQVVYACVYGGRLLEDRPLPGFDEPDEH